MLDKIHDVFKKAVGGKFQKKSFCSKKTARQRTEQTTETVGFYNTNWLMDCCYFRRIATAKLSELWSGLGPGESCQPGETTRTLLGTSPPQVKTFSREQCWGSRLKIMCLWLIYKKKIFFLHPQSHWRKKSDQRYGSPDPDPHQQVTDPQHCHCQREFSHFLQPGYSSTKYSRDL